MSKRGRVRGKPEVSETTRIPDEISKENVLTPGGGDPGIVEFAGPILLTAPHGISVLRGGYDGRPMQPHMREYWTSEITLKLAKSITAAFGVPASFMIWDAKKATPLNPANLDPNHLLRSQFPLCPWHRALEVFRNYGSRLNIPVFHVDIHGKKDRKGNLALDVGLGAMKAYWKDSELVETLETTLNDEFSTLFKHMGVIKNKLPFSVDLNPEMNGLFPDSRIFTMSSQSACLGIVSVQLEIPRTMRQRLFEDDEFLERFGDCLVQAYAKTLCNGCLKSKEWYTKYDSTPQTDIDALIEETEIVLESRKISRL